MSGLFRRLAGRALGQPGATQLHAMARLPYQAAPASTVEPPSPWFAEPQSAASSPLPQRLAMEPHGLEQQAVQQQAAPRPLPPQDALDWTSPRASTATKADSRPQDATVPAQTTALLAGLEPTVESPSPLPPAEPRRVVMSQDAVAQTAQHLFTALQPAPLTHPFTAKAQTPPPPTPTASRRSAAGSAAFPGLPEQPTAALSLPEAVLSPAPFSPPRHASPAPSTGPSERQREPDEVHVHIGRIEITAVQPPAPAKRASRKGQTPLSLDDYLARRKGDGT